MQTVLDAGRRTLTLPRRLVPTVMLLGTGGSNALEKVRLRDLVELERAGITEGGTLHPLAAEMLRVVTSPTRIITAETTLADATEISTVWVRGRGAVLGRPAGPDLFRLAPVEVGLLTFHLAQLVELSPRPSRSFAGSASVCAGLLDDLSSTWTADPASAVAALVADGVEPAWAERLTILHNHQVRRWRLSSLWIDSTGTAGDSEIIVIDAGSAGFWEVLPDAEDVGQVTFATRRFVDILEMLQGL